MSDSLGITGIGGYNPYMSGLGSLGLGAGSSFGNYGDPTGMMGMGYGGMGMMGMMGMYNPTFMKQMTQTQFDLEKMQLEHASAMHNLLQENKVKAYQADDTALFQKSMEDASINGLVVNLAEKIREGDADGICEEYDKLKLALYQKHNAYFREHSNKFDPAKSVNNLIENLYSTIISAKAQEPVSLRSDIKKYGETAFMHGFNEKFFGKKDYHDKYTEETISYLFGTRIDNKAGKDRMETIGGGFGRVAEGAAAYVGGAGVGLGVAGAAKLWNPKILQVAAKDEAGKIIKDSAGKVVKECGVKFGKTAKWLGAAALLGDIIWQFSRD